MSSIFTAIGLMSGTSLDGIDAAILKTDGESAIERGPVLFTPYSRERKVFIRRAVKAAIEGREAAADIGKASGEVTLAHVNAVENLLAAAGLKRNDIDVIGFHGQTILHRPQRNRETAGRTRQIGDAPVLARETGIDVVGDFRAADIAAGGEGAPLAPIYHLALARGLKRDGALAVLNLGGVANITWFPAGAQETDILAFDCGPGNGLIDEWMELRAAKPMDEDGALARSGKVHPEILRAMLQTPYLSRTPPKSLDRYDYKLDSALSLSAADGAATLTAFTAACVRASERFLPAPPPLWIVCGGGRRNPALMEALSKALSGSVVPAEEVGWRGDDLEAECFAYLAVRTLNKRPITFPKTTRAPRPLCGGVLHKRPAP
ncbi:MAG: anhydro-N-acetylmuramic acid kinase [Parvularculaceae bacterium]